MSWGALVSAQVALSEAKGAIRREAEREMRPYLANVKEAGTRAIERQGAGDYHEAAEHEAEALAAALEKALELLGIVQ